jgi:hypothetical protein
MTKNQEDTPVDTKAAVQALEYMFAAGYVSRKKLYLENFVRGIFFSVGSIIGATIVIALLIWILSLFDTAPLIGDLVKSLKNTLNSTPN